MATEQRQVTLYKETWKPVKRNSKWRAQINIRGKKKNLGRLNTKLEASDAYQTALNTI